MFSELPRFNAAKRYGLTLFALGVVFAVLGLALLEGALAQAKSPWFSGVPIPRALGYLGAALWVVSAGFLSSTIMSFVRRRLLAAEIGKRERPPAIPDQAAIAIATNRRNWRIAASRIISRLKIWAPDVESIASWPPVLASMLFGLFASVGVVALWRMPPEPPFDPVLLEIIGGGLVVAAFPFLVLQRLYATIAAELLPEAPRLDRLLRVPLTACLGLAIALILASVGFAWAIEIERLIALLIFVVSLELVLRSAAIVFIPFAPIERRQSVADSSIAGALLRLSLPSLRTMNIAVRRQLGIDLSRSWALAFLQKAALPVVVGIGLFAWGVTGITSLSITERGIYERLGAPVAVFGPGLHVHLPWPLGVIRPVEIGVVHLLPIEFLLPGGADAENSSSVGGDEKERLAGAEAPAPESADRLWTDDHPFEGNYIIASEENGCQSFQLVDIDMAVIYRVGLSEEAARNAAYRVTDIDELIQALSGQLLVRYFTQNNLLDLLGKSRETFSKQFQAALQEQLDRFSTGVEAIGVSVEAIHPPPGAASAYHDVQAAEIRANTRISVRRSEATRTLNSARQMASGDHNEALAAASELAGQAQSQSVLFGGDRQAYAQDGYPFLLERWLDNLAGGLGKSEFILVDHRLNGQSMPSLDLRNLGGPSKNDVLPGTSTYPDSPNTAPQAPRGVHDPSGGDDD